jgi:hypothetical protein
MATHESRGANSGLTYVKSSYINGFNLLFTPRDTLTGGVGGVKPYFTGTARTHVTPQLSDTHPRATFTGTAYASAE